MKNEINSKTLGALGSVLFAILIVGGFFYIWTGSKKVPASIPLAEDLKPIEIDSVKRDAENILDGLEKTSDIPISVPLEKMGKENPFVK